jgi:hypothetical protein
MLARVPVQVRQVDDTAQVTAFAAAWLVAELASSRPVDMVRCGTDLIELVVGCRDSADADALLGEVKQLLGEHRFWGWELCQR